MINSDTIRGFIDLIILSSLKTKDRYGYEISKEISERSNKNYEINEATLYACLNRLEKKGAITSYDGDISHGRKRKYYKISRLGEAYFTDLVISYQETKKVIDQFIGGEDEDCW